MFTGKYMKQTKALSKMYSTIFGMNFMDSVKRKIQTKMWERLDSQIFLAVDRDLYLLVDTELYDRVTTQLAWKIWDNVESRAYEIR
jgi:hypothetical protein